MSKPADPKAAAPVEAPKAVPLVPKNFDNEKLFKKAAKEVLKLIEADAKPASAPPAGGKDAKAPPAKDAAPVAQPSALAGAAKVLQFPRASCIKYAEGCRNTLFTD